jgi:hypothetical protein
MTADTRAAKAGRPWARGVTLLCVPLDVQRRAPVGACLGRAPPSTQAAPAQHAHPEIPAPRPVRPVLAET